MGCIVFLNMSMHIPCKNFFAFLEFEKRFSLRLGMEPRTLRDKLICAEKLFELKHFPLNLYPTLLVSIAIATIALQIF